MSFLLALDTVTDLCRCALYQGRHCLARQSDAIGKGHGEHLIGQIEKLFQQTKLDKNALSHIAVTTGPGSFTGMRIGVAVARSLALALGIEAVGMSRFDCIHHAVRQQLLEKKCNGSKELERSVEDLSETKKTLEQALPCAVILPAVQDKFALQIFSGAGIALEPPYQTTAAELIAQLPQPVILAGDLGQDAVVILKNHELDENKILKVSPEAEFDALAALSLEQFLKTGSHFSEKNRGKNKGLERSVKDLSETKTALALPSPQQHPSPLYMRPPDAKPAITNHIAGQNHATAAPLPNPPAGR